MFRNFRVLVISGQSNLRLNNIILYCQNDFCAVLIWYIKFVIMGSIRNIVFSAGLALPGCDVFEGANPNLVPIDEPEIVDGSNGLNGPRLDEVYVLQGPDADKVYVSVRGTRQQLEETFLAVVTDGTMSAPITLEAPAGQEEEVSITVEIGNMTVSTGTTVGVCLIGQSEVFDCAEVTMPGGITETPDLEPSE